MARALFALAALTLAAGCGGSKPPPELGGLWSAGQAACAAGVGVRFEADAIEAVYDRQRETLFARPRYLPLREGQSFRVRIEYELPRRPGGARSVGARGVLILARDNEGRIAPERHNLLDARTGAARLRIENDPAQSVLRLEPCEGNPRRGGLRGLSGE